VVLLTAAMMGVEIIAGWLFNSMALLADGWHMSTHAAALGIAWVAFILARRHAGSRRFTFGTWKIEILGGFVSAIFLGIVALVMTYVSVERFFHPVAIQFNEAIFIAAIGLVVNLVSVFLLTGKPHGHDHAHYHAHGSHDHGYGSDHDSNLNLRAAYLHVLADALTSVLAIAALLGGKYMNWNWLDPAMGIVGAVMIARWTFGLLKATGGILLDHGTNTEVEEEIRSAIESDGDTKISDLHLWQVGQDKYACVLAVIASKPQGLHTYKERLRSIHELAHVTVEIDLCG
jgi:cation diffusion facilitator family transporter